MGSEKSILDQLNDFIGENINLGDLGELVSQIKSLATENLTKENLNAVVQGIKSTYNDNQEAIKSGLGNLLGLIKGIIPSGKVTKFIECLQNDVNNPKCAEEALGASSSDQSASIATLTKVCRKSCHYYSISLLYTLRVL